MAWLEGAGGLRFRICLMELRTKSSIFGVGGGGGFRIWGLGFR